MQAGSCIATLVISIALYGKFARCQCERALPNRLGDLSTLHCSKTARAPVWRRNLLQSLDLATSHSESCVCFTCAVLLLLLARRRVQFSACRSSWVHSSEVRADDRKSPSPKFKSGRALQFTLTGRRATFTCVLFAGRTKGIRA